MNKLFYIFITALLLLDNPVFPQENMALAEKPEEHYAHNLYFVHMGNKITVEWTGSEPPWELRAWYPKLRKYYVLEDLDGDLENRECMFSPPRTGHMFVQLRSTIEGTWVDGKDTALPDEPIGWYLFVEPAPVTGGGIE